jgi:uncharacterized protein DUF3667
VGEVCLRVELAARPPRQAKAFSCAMDFPQPNCIVCGRMPDETTPLILGDALAAELGRPPRPAWWRRKKKTRPPLTHCENCGAQLVGPYCAQCGQAAIDYRRSLVSLLADAADAFFNFDARFFQSFGLLLFKPWRLTNEFIEGKRARHVHPLRVYLIASVIFFLVINFLSRGSHLRAQNDRHGVNLTLAPAEDVAPSTAASTPILEFDFSDTPSGAHPGLTINNTPPPLLAAPSPSASRKAERSPDQKVFFEELDKQKGIPPFVKWVEGRAKEKLGPTGDRGDLFMKALIQNIAPMVLCCIPLFALVLKILYIFKRRYYIDHLIFALHTHAFLFLSTVVIIGLGLLVGMGSTALSAVLCTLLGLAVFVELLIAIRRVYRQNWFATLFKFFLGSVIYSVLLGIAFGITAFLTLLLP